MRAFGRLAISLFIMGIVIFLIAYTFMPNMRDRFHNEDSPVGQLRPSDTIETHEQAPNTPNRDDVPAESR